MTEVRLGTEFRVRVNDTAALAMIETNGSFEYYPAESQASFVLLTT